jgi:hypothetical protein
MRIEAYTTDPLDDSNWTGTPSDPGLMVRSLADVFAARAALGPGAASEDFTVVCSYLEVYNEVRGGTSSI